MGRLKGIVTVLVGGGAEDAVNCANFVWSVPCCCWAEVGLSFLHCDKSQALQRDPGHDERRHLLQWLPGPLRGILMRFLSYLPRMNLCVRGRTESKKHTQGPIQAKGAHQKPRKNDKGPIPDRQGWGKTRTFLDI